MADEKDRVNHELSEGREEPERIARLETLLMEQRRDMRQLVRWLEILDEDIQRHFRSFSWRIGHATVGLAKKLMLKKHPPAESYRVAKIFEAFRAWKARRPEFAAGVRLPESPGPLPLSILAGFIGAESAGRLAEWAKLSGGRAAQVLGFAADKERLLETRLSENVRLSLFDPQPFPEFFNTLTRALTTVAGERLVVVDGGLGGLGLGLLCNYHFGTPLVLAGKKPSGDAGKDTGESPAWNEADYSDPGGSAWDELLESLTGAVPRRVEGMARWLDESGLERRVMPEAIRFAGLFADFYRAKREEP